MSPLPWTSSDEAARLTVQPVAPGTRAGGAAPGVHALDLGPGPEVLVRMPSANAGGPPRLVLTLHEAGENAGVGLQPLLPLADSHRLLLSPSSRDDAWDVIRHGGWGATSGGSTRRSDRSSADHQVMGEPPVTPRTSEVM